MNYEHSSLSVEPICQQVLRRLVELACDLLGAVDSAIWTLEGNTLSLRMTSAGYRDGNEIPLHGSLTGLAILGSGPVTSGDVRTDPRFHRPDLARAQGWEQAIVVPLMASDDLDLSQAGEMGNSHRTLCYRWMSVSIQPPLPWERVGVRAARGIADYRLTRDP